MGAKARSIYPDRSKCLLDTYSLFLPTNIILVIHHTPYEPELNTNILTLSDNYIDFT